MLKFFSIMSLGLIFWSIPSLSLNLDFKVKVPAATQQLIQVSPVGGVKALLGLYERIEGKWVSQKTFPAVIGHKGFAEEGKKIEGDQKTPSGIFEIGLVFGYAEKIDTQMPYRAVSDEDKFIDDVTSAEYNTWVRGPTTAKSYEKMKRDDLLYEYGAVINYNMNPVIPGKGSAIFLHVWRNANSGTAGCVALDRSDVIEILKWLNPKSNPVIILNN